MSNKPGIQDNQIRRCHPPVRITEGHRWGLLGCRGHFKSLPSGSEKIESTGSWQAGLAAGSSQVSWLWREQVTTGPIWPPKGRTPVHPLCTLNFVLTAMTLSWLHAWRQLWKLNTLLSYCVFAWLCIWSLYNCMVGKVNGYRPSQSIFNVCLFARANCSSIFSLFSLRPRQCFEMHHVTKNRLLGPNASFTQFGTSELLQTTSQQPEMWKYLLLIILVQEKQPWQHLVATISRIKKSRGPLGPDF